MILVIVTARVTHATLISCQEDWYSVGSHSSFFKKWILSVSINTICERSFLCSNYSHSWGDPPNALSGKVSPSFTTFLKKLAFDSGNLCNFNTQCKLFMRFSASFIMQTFQFLGLWEEMLSRASLAHWKNAEYVEFSLIYHRYDMYIEHGNTQIKQPHWMLRVFQPIN